MKPAQGVRGSVSWDQLEQSPYLHRASVSSCVKWLLWGLKETLQGGTALELRPRRECCVRVSVAPVGGSTVQGRRGLCRGAPERPPEGV